MPHERETRVEGVIALGVFVYLARHGANHCQIVSHFSCLWENGTYWHAALAVFFKLERTGKGVAILVKLRPLYLNGHWLARIFLECGFGIKGVDMRSSARHVAENDALCLWLKVRLGGCQGRLRPEHPLQGQ